MRRYYRNVMCPNYDKCLAKEDFDAELPTSFNCAGCRNKRYRLSAGYRPATYPEGCRKLLAALYRPDLLPNSGKFEIGLKI